MVNYAVPANLMQAIANYLGSRPYLEVVGMIDAIKECKEVPAQPETSEQPEPSK